MLRKASASWSTISAYARSPQPQTIQSTLLARNNQKPQLRLNFRCEPTIQAAATVTAIAGHWSQLIMLIFSTTPHRDDSVRAARSVLQPDERSYRSSRSAPLP